MTRLRTLLPSLVPALVTVVLTVALGVSLTACSGGDDAADTHNAADVSFAQGMIPHHAQAVAMADQALAKATDPRIRTLAKAIKAAQDPEIATMTGWLRTWGEKVPDTTGSMSSTGSGGDMDGMMSADQMSALDAASGPRFDRLWLRQMVQHHTGAIAAARAEVSDGRDPDAIALARRIETSQQSEVDQMTGWLRA